MIKNILRYIIVFIGTFVICVGLLLAVCQIPQSAIQENCAASSVYFSSQGGFPVLIDGHANTRIDNYADCVLLNVIYNVDEEQPLQSVIAAPYYRIEGNDSREDFASAVIEGKEPNNEYSRYWHGSQVFIRPLLLFASVEQIRWILFGLFAVLNVVLGVLLIRRKAYVPAGVYFGALLLVQFWMCAFSIEYVMSFLVMTAACIAVVVADRHMTCIFIISGAVTCFLDFLTTETLTFTVPFILYMMLCKNEGGKEQFLRLLKWGSAWLTSYAAMFAIKWALVYGVMGEQAFRHVLESAAYRIDGEVAEGSVFMAVLRNIACLLPASDQLSAAGIIGISLGILLLLAALFYLFRGERVDGAFIGILLLTAAIPYLRYLCLSSHSFVHYFFTYRAQMAAIMAVAAVLAYQLKPSHVLPAQKRRKRK